MRPLPPLVCVGHAALDLIYRVDAFPARPTKVPASSLALSGGGMASNAACAIARLGGDVRFAGAVGDDVFGTLVADDLRRHGVDIAQLARIDGASTSVSSVVVDAAGERLVINHRGSALDAAPPDFGDALAGVAVLLCDVRWLRGARAAFAAARAAGVPSVLDADVAAPAILGELVQLADHVVFSEPGFACWAGQAIEADGAQRKLEALVGAHCALAAVTLGERGVLHVTSRGTARLPAFGVDAVETLGAGDVFHGAYALALAEHASIDEALRFASAAAAEKCRRAGGRAALPVRLDVEARMRRG
ncbi:MAG: PfkB family carbohydrate kinase [Betaproteobacteria bacterium]